MALRSVGSALGVLAGALLALGVVVLASSVFNSSGMSATPTASIPNQTLGVTPGSAAVSSPSPFNIGYVTVFVPHPDSIARQPISLTAFFLLPIFAAFLFGFVLYRVIRARSEEEEPVETA